jgi:hypothetical protein
MIPLVTFYSQMQKLKTYTFALSCSKSQFALLHLGDMGKVACSENSTCFRNAHNLLLVSVGYEVQAFFCTVLCVIEHAMTSL